MAALLPGVALATVAAEPGAGGAVVELPGAEPGVLPRVISPESGPAGLPRVIYGLPLDTPVPAPQPTVVIVMPPGDGGASARAMAPTVVPIVVSRVPAYAVQHYGVRRYRTVWAVPGPSVRNRAPAGQIAAGFSGGGIPPSFGNPYRPPAVVAAPHAHAVRVGGGSRR